MSVPETNDRDLVGSRADSPHAFPAAVEQVPCYETIIEPDSGSKLIDLRELYQYRDLLWFLTWRGIKVRYAQSAIGIGWAIIQPAFQITMFTMIFGRLAQISTDGVPHSAFYLATMSAWLCFANAVNSATDSLIGNSQMLSKVYFPRIILPLTATLATLFDFAIAFFFSLLALLLLGVRPGLNILYIPLLAVLMASFAFGISLWTSAMSIQYRDVKHAISFIVQLLMYASPVIYPTSLIPAEVKLGSWKLYPQWIYAANPLVGVLEGFRASLLGQQAMPWAWIGLSAIVTSVVVFTGLHYFRSREKVFADVA
ncbi:MAG: ABC transporter permease [Planctomycetota bacterium]